MLTIKGQGTVFSTEPRLTLNTRGPVCLQCDQVAHPSDCRNVKRCGEQERCSPITSIFGKRNDANGILPSLRTNARQNTLSDMLRSAGDTIICEKCCSGDICNAGSLCGTAGFLHEMVCFNCSSTHEDRCTTIELCDQDENCFIEYVQNSTTSNHVLDTGCRKKDLCQQLQSGQGTDCLSSCCSSDLCNRKCSRNNIGAMCVDNIPKCTNKTFQSFVCSEPQLQTVCQKSCGLCHCAPNPCTHGTCTSSPIGYKCTCDAGYTGSICDRDCNPDPCVQGTCYNSPQGYNCSCFATDGGSSCTDCHSNPCIHGTCHDSSNWYTCTCDIGFTGKICDTVISAPPGTLWKWTDCGNPATRSIIFSHLDIFPKPLHIPGNITTAYDITINRRIDHLRINLTVEKKVMNDWVFVPCKNLVGSCFYADVCTDIDKCCSTLNCTPETRALLPKCPIDPVHMIMNYHRRGNRSSEHPFLVGLGLALALIACLASTGLGFLPFLSGSVDAGSTWVLDYLGEGDVRIMAEFVDSDEIIGCLSTALSIRG